MPRLSRQVLPLLLLLVFVTGCVTEKIDGDGTHVFKYELWVPVLAVVGGALLTAVGIPLLKLLRKLGVGCILTGIIAAVLVAPSLFTGNVTVNEHGFKVGAGMKKHAVKFEELSALEYCVEKSVNNDGKRSISHVLVCEKKNGTVERIPVGAEIVKQATPTIIRFARARGVGEVSAKVQGSPSVLQTRTKPVAARRLPPGK